MSVEIEGTESSEKPNIINSTVLIDEKEVVIPTLNGRAYRGKVVAQLGKRFVCKQTIETTSTREETDPQTGKTRVATSKTVNYFGGLMEDVNGMVFI